MRFCDIAQRQFRTLLTNAPWFCSFRLWRYINHLLTYLLTYSRPLKLVFALFWKLVFASPAEQLLHLLHTGSAISSVWRLTSSSYSFYSGTFCKAIYVMRLTTPPSTGWAKKKWTPNALHITSSNISRFLKFFHRYNLQKICNAAVINYSTTPQTCCYTTSWNVYVRKLACSVRCGA